MASLRPKYQPFDYYAGDNISLVFTLEGTVDLSGAEGIVWTLGDSQTAAPLITKTLAAAQIVVTDGPNRVCRVDFLLADWAGLEGHRWHELTVKIAGQNETGAYGPVRVTGSQQD